MPDVEVCRADKLLFTGECVEDSDEDIKKKLIRAKLKVRSNFSSPAIEFVRGKLNLHPFSTDIKLVNITCKPISLPIDHLSFFPPFFLSFLLFFVPAFPPSPPFFPTIQFSINLPTSILFITSYTSGIVNPLIYIHSGPNLVGNHDDGGPGGMHFQVPPDVPGRSFGNQINGIAVFRRQRNDQHSPSDGRRHAHTRLSLPRSELKD